MVCFDCYQRIQNQLTDLPVLYIEAGQEYWPQGGQSAGRSTERTLGFRVAALDFRNLGSAIECLEDWERDWRLKLPRFDGAWKMPHLIDPDEEAQRIEDALRRAQLGRSAEFAKKHAGVDRHARMLCGLVDFFLTHLDHACEEHTDMAMFAEELGAIHRAAQVAAREPQPDVTVISCPADADAGLCGASLRLTGEFVCCPRCSTEWSRPRLLLVARSVDADVWQPAGVVSEHLGVPPSTLSLWARQGHVKRRGTTYLWSSVVAHVNARHADVDAV